MEFPKNTDQLRIYSVAELELCSYHLNNSINQMQNFRNTVLLIQVSLRIQLFIHLISYNVNLHGCSWKRFVSCTALDHGLN